MQCKERLKHNIASSFFGLLLVFMPGFLCAFQTIDPAVTFPNAAQGHGTTGSTGTLTSLRQSQLVIFRRNEINNTDGPLPFRSIYRYLQGTCDDSRCQITGTQVPSLDLTQTQNLFRSSSGTRDVTQCPSQTLGQDGTTQFDDLNVSSTCTINFSSSHQEYRFNDLNVNRNVTLVLQAGDYWFRSLRMNGGHIQLANAANTRIFVESSFRMFNRSEINTNGDASQLQMVLYRTGLRNSVSLTFRTEFKGSLYVNGGLSMFGAQITGSVTAQRLLMALRSEINGADTTPPNTAAQIQFGRSSVTTIGQSVRVNFDTAFTQTPLVFLMPQIKPNETTAQPPWTFSDQPSSVRVVSVDNNGFFFEQLAPPNTPSPIEPMAEVDWFATIPGTQQLSDGTTIYAGKEMVSAFQGDGVSGDSWHNIPFPAAVSTPVAITERQTNNANCWLTDAVLIQSNSIDVALEVSEVSSTSGTDKCLKVTSGQFPLQNLQEDVAYLITASRSGAFSLGGQSYDYQFGRGSTPTGDLDDQCVLSAATSFGPSFTVPPIVVANKHTRNGSNGGWLRRCYLSASQYAPVLDEDVYRDSERYHIAENYSFFAVENTNVQTLDHFELRYPETASACAPGDVTLKACANSDCSTLYTGSVSATLIPSAGWSSNPVTFTGGQTMLSLGPSTSGPLVLDIASASPSGSLDCFKNGQPDAACTINILDSVFAFDIPTHTAGQKQTTTVIAQDIGGGSCGAAVTGNRTLNFTFAYLEPSTGAGQVPSVDGNALSTSASVPITLQFNSAGQADFDFDYNDAGAISLSLSYTSPSATVITGSDITAVLPEKIQLSSSEAIATCTGSSDSQYASCSVFKTTGQAFTLNAVAGFTQSGTFVTTPNFKTGHLTTAPDVLPQLVAPVAGSTGGELPTSLTMLQGTDTTTRVMNEVGVYRFGVADFIAYPTYQDESPKINVPVAYSDPIGRFVPSSLSVELENLGEFAPNCASGVGFSYVGQDMTYVSGQLPAIKVQGVNQNDEVTANYQGAFAKISGTQPGFTVTTQNLGTDALALPMTSTLSSGTWTEPNPSEHIYTLSASDTLRFDKVATADVSVFSFNADYDSVIFSDSDGVATSNQVQFTPAGHEMRFASLVADNASGSELEDLPMPIYIAYRGPNGLIKASDDQCTQLNPAVLQMNSNSAGNFSNIALSNGSGTSTATFNTASSPTCGSAVCLQPQSGDFGFVFSAPGENQTGQINVQVQSTLPLWLQQQQGGNIILPYSARGSFGFYRGNDKINYKRDVQ